MRIIIKESFITSGVHRSYHLTTVRHGTNVLVRFAVVTTALVHVRAAVRLHYVPVGVPAGTVQLVVALDIPVPRLPAPQQQ